MRTENDISLSKQVCHDTCYVTIKNKRDEDRRIACKQAGITLIEIPHWWDETERK